jgi:hypothetical protein
MTKNVRLKCSYGHVQQVLLSSDIDYMIVLN